MAENLPEFIDKQAFDQILDMDDDPDDRDFSRDIVFGFFDQVQNIIKQMKSSIESNDLEKLSSLGHYLKGSSATIGLTRIKDACEAIQNLGKNGSDNKTMELVQKNLSVITEGSAEAEKYLKTFYNEDQDPDRT